MKKNLLFYLGELLIVIIGVSVAFWLNQLGEEKKETKIKNAYFKELQTDIKNDLLYLDHIIKLNDAKQSKLIGVMEFYSDSELYKDSILNYVFEIGSYNFFNPKDITYRSIITSGDFKIIQNSKIKRGLIKLHDQYDMIEEAQDNFLDALDENFFPFLVANVDYLSGQPINTELHRSLKIKNYFMYTINDLTGHLQLYANAKKTAIQIDSLIHFELEKYDQ